MAPKFGTSGLRGLVTELTDDLVAAHVLAFLRACETGTGLFVGRDLRASSPHIADVVMRTAAATGVAVFDAGRVPTPALSLAAMRAEAAAIMVTGSHIPDDRNGLKFYTPSGEITKENEMAISAAVTAGPAEGATVPPAPPEPVEALAAYRDRYLDAFAPDLLSGLRVGLFAQSTVARDVLGEILSGLGAEIRLFGRSDSFIPVDTEALSPEMRAQLADWGANHPVDAIVSADGDGDRPLLTDGAGVQVPGDLLGLLTARHLGADHVVVPISSTTALELSEAFATVTRTRIGSPFVIAGIEAAEPDARIAGFEPNGGFLLGWEVDLLSGRLPPLMTRDGALPLICTLAEAHSAGGLHRALSALPQRHTAADRLQNVDMGAAQALMAQLKADTALRRDLWDRDETGCDLTDGVRWTGECGDILHVRMSGNAAELRCYAEARTKTEAAALVQASLAKLKARLSTE